MSVGEEAWRESRRLFKTALLAGGGLALIFVASFLSTDPQGTFFRILSILGTALLLVSVLMMILTFRMAKAVVPGALVVSLAITIGVLTVQLAVAPDPPSAGVSLILLAGGLLIGVGWAMTTVFFVDSGTVRSRGNALYLAVWALTFLIHQGFVIIGSSAPSFTLSGLMAATGIAAGNTLGQLIRYRRAWAIVERQQRSNFEGVHG